MEIHVRAHRFIRAMEPASPSAALAVTVAGNPTTVVSAGGVVIVVWISVTVITLLIVVSYLVVAVWTTVMIDPLPCLGSTMFRTAT